MALENKTISGKYDVEKLRGFVNETLYEQNFMHLKDDLPDRNNPTYRHRVDGVTTAISMAIQSLPAWSLETIDQILDGKEPDNLDFEAGALDPELRGKDIVSYIDALAQGIREGRIAPADKARAEEFYLERDPELQAKVFAETANKKFGIDPRERENREQIEKNKVKLEKEAAKERQKREKLEIKAEKAIQKQDRQENKALTKTQKERGKYQEQRAKLRDQVLERGEDGKYRRKPGVSDKKVEAYQKASEQLKRTSEKYEKLIDSAIKKVDARFKNGEVTQHYRDYRSAQLETGTFNYKIAQTFGRQEWNKAMLERAGLDKLPKAEQKVKIEAYRKQVAEAETKKAEKAKDPVKRKVEPAEIGMDKKAPEKKSADVKKEAPAAQLAKKK